MGRARHGGAAAQPRFAQRLPERAALARTAGLHHCKGFAGRQQVQPVAPRQVTAGPPAGDCGEVMRRGGGDGIGRPGCGRQEGRHGVGRRGGHPLSCLRGIGWRALFALEPQHVDAQHATGRQRRIQLRRHRAQVFADDDRAVPP